MSSPCQNIGGTCPPYPPAIAAPVNYDNATGTTVEHYVTGCSCSRISSPFYFITTHNVGVARILSGVHFFLTKVDNLFLLVDFKRLCTFSF